MSSPFNLKRVSTRDGLDVLFSFDTRSDADRFLDEAIVELWAPNEQGILTRYLRVSEPHLWLDRPVDYAERSVRFRVFLSLMDPVKISPEIGHQDSIYIAGQSRDGLLRVVVHERDISQTYAVGREDLYVEYSEDQDRIQENLDKIKVIQFPGIEKNKK